VIRGSPCRYQTPAPTKKIATHTIAITPSQLAT
jgi:hypothetical protein